ncbi:hypothetical protein B0J12DRAFT_182135 [Macrophomina phaseolina]|uniref:Uncharacterized protein n=1 Tax=Macrophomina phaseolina TaxID=35725 RepID=A0ABQ8G7D2_9PEZI|nr:hypothetical protein B0J12DRAFT_182135 [Macrophomina phaseolina]
MVHGGLVALLSYKYSMVKLSIIVKSALGTLYGLGKGIVTRDSSARGDGTRLQNTICSVSSLEARLQRWCSILPEQPKFTDSRELAMDTGTTLLGETHRDAFEHHLFELQGLSLKLGFENARTLIYSPFLSFKMTVHHSPSSRLAYAPPQLLLSIGHTLFSADDRRFLGSSEARKQSSEVHNKATAEVAEPRYLNPELHRNRNYQKSSTTDLTVQHHDQQFSY